ncbi:MAG: SHOCT-like domain-containing protein [Bacillota bacterium]
MSEERKMILQMLADGKISADEAETLLQAIEESERTAQETVVEGAQKSDRNADGLTNLGRVIDYAVSEATQALDETFRTLEDRLKHDQARQEQLKRRIEERIRISTERALERALEMEERAKRAAERAEMRLQEKAERIARRHAELAEREAERARRDAERAHRDTERVGREEHRLHADHPPFIKKTIVKMGVHIDKVSIQRTSHLTLAAQPGDRFIAENKIGDIQVEFYEGDQIEVEAHKTVWGADEADANERALATEIALVRTGSDVRVEIERPTYAAVGVIHLKDTRIDLKVRLPRGTHLQAVTKVGDLRVRGDQQISTWSLAARVGDIDITVPEDAGFRYTLAAKMGSVKVDLQEQNLSTTLAQGDSPGGEPGVTGTYGSGQGQIEARVGTGDIRLHHEHRG